MQYQVNVVVWTTTANTTATPVPLQDSHSLLRRRRASPEAFVQSRCAHETSHTSTNDGARFNPSGAGPEGLANEAWRSSPRRRDAAAVLGVSSGALRKLFERRALRASDGGTEAELDGVRARKFAGRWRVSFGEAWNGR
jgi:hypothetical protein